MPRLYSIVANLRALFRPAFVLPLLPTLALGVWLYLPSLELGLYADDYLAVAALDGAFAAPRAPLDLFNFADGTRADVRALMRRGSVPWWAPDDLRIAFLRPLSSALWHLDRALFGADVRAYHLHSLAAWALLAVVAAALYRRLFPGVLWAFAVAAFALDHSQHFPVLWLSNRGGLYATAAGVLALHLHLRFREDGNRACAAGSAACAAVGLLFGEWVFPVFAYLIAYELVAARDNVRRRVLALLPVGALALAFLVARGLLGYGARGSGAYVDPLDEPLRFGLVLLTRIPVFAADMLWNVPAAFWDHGSAWRDTILRWNLIPPPLWARLPSWAFWHLQIGVLSLLSFGALLAFTYRALSQGERRALRFLLLGSLLSLIPVAGSFASTRLTLAAYLGVAPAAMLILRQLIRWLVRTPLLPPLRWAGCYALAVAVLYLQLLSPLRRDFGALVADMRSSGEWAVAADLGARAREQRVYLLSAVEFTSTFYFSYVRQFHGHPPPRSFQPIAVTPHAVTVIRESPHSLLVQALGGAFTTSGVEHMFRRRDEPLALGARIELDGLTIEVVRVLQGQPWQLRLRFDLPVDHPDHVLLISTARGLVRFEPPAIGEQERLVRPIAPSWFAVRRARDERHTWPRPDFLQFDPAPFFVEYDPRDEG